MITRCRAPPAGAGLLHAAVPGHPAAVVDETGSELPWGQGGILVAKAVAVDDPHHLGRSDRFVKSYYPGRLPGQVLPGGRRRDPRQTGYFTITGRIDDVLNVSGHRMGTMEIESAWLPPLVAEAAVVGRPDDLTGEASSPSWSQGAPARPAIRKPPRRSSGTVRLGWQGNRPDRQAEGHPLR